jgi:hypothetical protein
MEDAMLPNMCPADELALVRAQLRELQDREADLKIAFLTRRAPLLGRDHRVEIRSHNNLVFQSELLPENILKNPSYWRARNTKQIRVKPVLVQRVDNFDVIEQY